MNNNQVITRFAPSPTGYLHIGGVRTALFCWLYARQKNGKFLLRIEDTDTQRSTKSATDAIIDGLSWLALDHDDELIFQSTRFSHYQQIAQHLLSKGQAYHCICSQQQLEQDRQQQIEQGLKPKYTGRCRDKNSVNEKGQGAVIRFKTPLQGKVKFNDIVHGEIVINNEELDDFIILRSDQSPTYNFTVAIDDSDMAISHVIRGDDHINNTPKQIHVLNALQASIPNYAHLPMINGSDGQKLSKRHGAVSVLDYKEQGFLPEALLNYLARLGWSHKDQEIFSMDEMINLFSLDNLTKSSASFDVEKLTWVNGQHIKSASANTLANELANYLDEEKLAIKSIEQLEQICDVYRDKAKTMKQMASQIDYLFNEEIEYDNENAEKFLVALVNPALENIKTQLQTCETWQPESIGAIIKTNVKQSGLKFPQIAQALRIALTGNTNSPSIDQTIYLTGQKISVERIEQAINVIKNR